MKQHRRILFSKDFLAKKKLCRQVLSMVMVLVICSSFFPFASANANPILSDWAKEEAFLAEQQGLLPQERLFDDLRGSRDRGQAVEYLVLLTETILQKEIPNTAKGVYSDLDHIIDSVVTAAEKAYSAGIVLGYENNRFARLNTITREEYATMLYRLFQYVEKEKNVQLLPDRCGEQAFSDRVEISLWAVDAIDTLSSMGVFCGRADGSFDPGSSVSAEQIIVLSYRCWKYCTSKLL